MLSSPYSDSDHLLDLSSLISSNSRLLAVALTNLRTVRSDYAVADYQSSFNWSEIVSLLEPNFNDDDDNEFYIVAFRSQLKSNITSSELKHLYSLDKYSHKEANASGGLLKYWFGIPRLEDRRNLATCIWTNRDSAVKVVRGENRQQPHVEAMRITSKMYDEWKMERYIIKIGSVNKDGIRTWTIKPFEEQ
ncbi:unnamed protein product [Didymodactylos carnosus]|uniref:Uncharacterized protein n=1 Tax=Didymodactylos carnosus TaxID=1234261 RepID=A0A8S2UYG3_9BILA|nr:unnamed protein product [Didymodactylos carnosus]CAF4370428.1 unnamed protein product [Didymodactylos carnosus]